MHDQEFRAVAMTKEQAHAGVMQAYAHAQALLANGERVVITAAPLVESISTRQRGFFHAAVLPQISEQVRIGGERYTADIWKEHLRRLFLPDTWEMRKLPGANRATPVRVRSSTERLGVKGYSEHIDKVIAHAVTEWGVEFRFDASEREAVRYVAPRRKQQEAATACSATTARAAG